MIRPPSLERSGASYASTTGIKTLKTLNQLEDLTLSVQRREVARLLGYTPGQMPRRVLQVIADAERRSHELVRPMGVFRVLERADYVHSDYLKPVGRVVIALVSIGAALERDVERLRDEGQVGAALILDAYGSAAAEAAAEAADTAIRSILERGPTRCSRRVSPGYGGWDVAEQRWIVDALRGHEIGVTLTGGCMMVPRKSVTFAMTVGRRPLELYDEDPCTSCGAADCPWRNTPYQCPGRPHP